MDARRIALTTSLAQLSDVELRRILDYPGEMVYDGCNYDEATGRYCPMAVALKIPERITKGWHGKMVVTDSLVEKLIGVIGNVIHGPAFAYNQMHGVPGEFYRDPHRAEDVRTVCEHILEWRQMAGDSIGNPVVLVQRVAEMRSEHRGIDERTDPS